MHFNQPITDIIRKRYSCRSYRETPIEQEVQQQLADVAAGATTGPFGSRARFELVAASEQDRQALRGLGTYGFIKGATGFIVGATRAADRNLEDFGYLMERIILYATDLGLGTCWLGGSFTKSRFAQKIGATRAESVPAVASLGYEAERPRRMDAVIRQGAGAHRRLSWDQLFFTDSFGRPLSREAAGAYATVLEMVRLGPSASNKQPWRVVHIGDCWHLYLQRTPGYAGGITGRLLRIADMQRVDMGIAMSHFELTASELGLAGQWLLNDPCLELPDQFTEYVVSWQADGLR